MFNDDILGNISLGLRCGEKANDADIEECIKLAELGDTIARLPKGLRTSVGYVQNAMSAGQDIRVALARAKLRDNPILILDEVTGALDRITADKMIRKIRSWRRDKTTIVITHDLNQILPDDYLYVLDAGRVVQHGQRSALEKTATGAFAELSRHESKRSRPQLSASSQSKAIYSHDDSSILAPSFSSSPEENSPTRLCTSYDKRMSRPIRPDGDWLSWSQKSTTEILLTSWLCFSRQERLNLVKGFLFAGLHATTIPAFSFCFSRLLGVYIDFADDAPHPTWFWTFAILLVAITDAAASYFMHLFLEQCSQAWINTLRLTAFRRILDQPSLWFHATGHSANKLAQTLDRDAEEMRSLLSRFAGLALVASIRMFLAIGWAFAVCWKLTLVTVSLLPLIAVLAQTYETLSVRWEKNSNRAAQAVSAIFNEALESILHVKALTLEPYFRRKHLRATSIAMDLAARRAFLSGLFFGASDAGIIIMIGE